MDDSAVDALRHALRSIGGDVTAEGALVLPTGRLLEATVRGIGAVDAATATHLADAQRPDEPTVVVADLVPSVLRPALNRAGVNWLDRRGHLRIATAEIWIDTDVAPTPRATAARHRVAVSGPAQIGVAVAHLVGWRFGVRELARRVGLSPAAISRARAGLVDAGLIDDDGEPAVPELFWALADAWTIRWEALETVPEPGIGVLVDVGSAAAADLGAPVVLTADWPFELVGIDAATVERARLRNGVIDGRGPCRLGLAPSPLVGDPDLLGAVDRAGHPVGHPLFLALGLAQDPARGSEALTAWDPEGFTRVW